MKYRIRRKTGVSCYWYHAQYQLWWWPFWIDIDFDDRQETAMRRIEHHKKSKESSITVWEGE